VLYRPGYWQHRPEGKLFGSNDIARIRVHARRHAQSTWVRYRECLSASLNHSDVNLFVYSLLNNACGFGGLEVACWPLVPKFAGSHPAEAVGFLG
jgi:hypothetical protein